MAKIDALLKRLCDMNGERLMLVSDQPCRILKTGGGVQGAVLNQQQILTLFNEIAPPEAQEKLKTGTPCKFVYQSPHGNFDVGFSLLSGVVRLFATFRVRLGKPARVVSELRGFLVCGNHILTPEDDKILIEIQSRLSDKVGKFYDSTEGQVLSVVASVGLILAFGETVDFSQDAKVRSNLETVLEHSPIRACVCLTILAPPALVYSKTQDALGRATIDFNDEAGVYRIKCDVSNLITQETGLASIHIIPLSPVDWEIPEEASMIEICVWMRTDNPTHPSKAAQAVAQYLLCHLP